ncbi:MAG: hypothetical protein IPL08_17910 [Saprospiraceae bacterium]|nr:hypothetical protein [Saprospiraceae bacterium]
MFNYNFRDSRWIPVAATDEDGHQSEMSMVSEKTMANSTESVIPNIKILQKQEILFLSWG